MTGNYTRKNIIYIARRMIKDKRSIKSDLKKSILEG